MLASLTKRPATLLFAGLLALAACSGSDGSAGANGATGPAGPAGPAGQDGATGPAGESAPVPAGAGLEITIQAVTFAADNTPSATIKFTDAEGKPLDFLAELAAGSFGARGPRYTIARLEADGTYRSLYENATTHTASSFPASGSDVAAMYAKVGEGVYTFKWPAAPAAAPTAGATYTVGTWATRTSAGVSYPKSTTFDFVPGGGTPAVREVVSDAACNACHKNMQEHGSRRGEKLCRTCHYPGFVDADTGAVIDWRVMVHQIHGSDAGPGASGMTGGHGTYPGFEHVVFAPRENEVRRCESCHQGATADNWKKASGAACYSCHAHPETFAAPHDFPDQACAFCHGAGMALAVDTVHSKAWDDATNTVAFTPKKIDVVIKSIDATDYAAVKVTFTISVNGAAYDLKNTPLVGSLRLVAGGPVGPDTDFGATGAPYLSDGKPVETTGWGYRQSLSLTNPANFAEVAVGEYTTTFPALDPGCVGKTIAIGAEGYAGEEDVEEWPITRPSLVFAKVGGGEAAERRAVADDAKCNACHVNLGFHGGNGRKGVEYCAFCHHSKNENNDRMAWFEVMPDTTTPYSVQPQTVWLPVMVHRIHRGGDLANPYILGGNPGPSATNPAGTPHLFGGGFPQPGAMLNCLSCHKPGTFGLPGPAVQPMLQQVYTCNEAPAADTNDLCETANRVVTSTRYVPPQQAICQSCHDDDGTAAHVELNTTAGGLEACSACHGDGRDWDAAAVHVAPQ